MSVSDVQVDFCLVGVAIAWAAEGICCEGRIFQVVPRRRYNPVHTCAARQTSPLSSGVAMETSCDSPQNNYLQP